MASSGSNQLIDPKVWEDLQGKIDDDTKTRDSIRDIVQDLEKLVKRTISGLSNAHTTFDSSAAIKRVETELLPHVIQQIGTLNEVASKHPYYKFNNIWSRQMQDATYAIVFCGWCGGYGKAEGTLLPIEEVGQIMKVPVNVKDRDTFHLTIEEYLHALVSLIDELARLSRNSVTQGNYQRPALVSQFVKDLHAGFQLLNLKNDSLRKRSDGIKYRVREVEDIIYDLSLRNLLPRQDTSMKDGE